MLQLFKGIAFRRTMTVVDSAGARTDLTGKTIIAQIRRRTDAAIELAVGTGITLLTQSGDTLGQATLEVTGLASQDLQVGAYKIVVLIDGQVAMAPTPLPVRQL